MSLFRWTYTRRRRLALALLAAAAVAAPAGGSSTTKPRLKPIHIAITLLSPVTAAVVPRYGPSPVFDWLIKSTSAAPLHGSGRLEVSTTSDFAQSAIWRFECGYSAGDCIQHHQWLATSPYWYDEANSCDDVPAVGKCGALSKTLFWRVRYQPVGGKSWSSPTGRLQRSVTSDSTRPKVQAENGSAAYGVAARVLFWVSDDSGTTRDIVQIYDGGQVVFGMRTQWDSVNHTSLSYRYLDLPLPASIEPGTYRWCLTAQDQSDNRGTDCATYTITGSGA